MFTNYNGRFVDRDMFMRYRGGGIGHRYMRAIETGYENMSRERIHHKERHRAARSQETAMDASNTEDANIDNSDSEGEAEAPVHQAQVGGRGQNTSNNNNDSGGDDDDDEDYEYTPASDESGSSGISDSDELDSDGCEGYEGTYGLAGS